MKKLSKLLSVMMVISMLFCLGGCGKNESDYKEVIEEHLKNKHNLSINSYEIFNIRDDGGATATVNATAKLAGMNGTMEIRIELALDENANICSCSSCDIFG